MKLRSATLLTLVFLLAGCARLPRMEAPATGNAGPATDCSRIFPRGRWQLVHTIEAAPPGGQRQTLIGISRICSDRRTIHCVLMSPEGMVLFEAIYDGHPSVRRAIGPLSAGGFAEGVIGDILLMFFAPEGALQKTGRFPSGAAVLRYATKDQGTRDIIALPQGDWRICAYDARNRLRRTVTYAKAGPGSPEGTSPRIALEAHGPAGYRLDLTLLEARPLLHMTH